MDRTRILALAEAQRAFVVAARRHIHQRPELSFQERETAAFVAERLREIGYEPRTGLGRSGTGLTAVLDGARPGPTLALRADMDALPVQELNDLPFRSERDGAMHACGHDAHTAMLLGAARALMDARGDVAGRVVFLFQHAEELPPGGALELIEAGALDGVDAVFGLHQSADLDVGQMGFVAGPRQASTDNFRLTVLGKGGHAAAPHRGVDAIQVAAHLVTALHQVVSRRVSPLEPAVLSIGTINGGTKENVVAHEVTLAGTVRTLDAALRDQMQVEIERVARGVTAAWGAEVTCEYLRGYPVTVNEPRMTDVARRAAELVLEPSAALTALRPSMPAEDFSYYLQRVPGSFASLGVGTPGSTNRGGSHSGAFLLDEAALPIGVAYYLSLVTNFSTLEAAG
ncbi:MAG: amidohydrolase [Dehalococcoidia bacterium]